MYSWETRILLAENEKLWLFEYLIAGLLFWVKFFGHLVTKNKLKSSATQTQDFCEKNVLKLQDFEEVLWKFYYPGLPTTQIWLIPLVDNFACVATHHKIGKKQRKWKRKPCLIAISFSFLGGPIIQSRRNCNQSINQWDLHPQTFSRKHGFFIFFSIKKFSQIWL